MAKRHFTSNNRNRNRDIVPINNDNRHLSRIEQEKEICKQTLNELMGRGRRRNGKNSESLAFNNNNNSNNRSNSNNHNHSNNNNSRNYQDNSKRSYRKHTSYKKHTSNSHNTSIDRHDSYDSHDTYITNNNVYVDNSYNDYSTHQTKQDSGNSSGGFIAGLLGGAAAVLGLLLGGSSDGD